MLNIEPVSDLSNYGKILQSIEIDQPVFLTKNGQDRYAVLDIHDYDKIQAAFKLMSELSKGKASGQQKGWLTAADVAENLGVSDE